MHLKQSVQAARLTTWTRPSTRVNTSSGQTAWQAWVLSHRSLSISITVPELIEPPSQNFGPAGRPGQHPPLESPLESGLRRTPTNPSDSVDHQRRYSLGDEGRTFSWREPFERDCDRILHARAFRRLAGKTQLIPVGEGRQVRNRLTHTLEVASAARSLARHLGLREDLTEAIALAHDLGQPAFGKAGVRALDRLLREGLGRRVPGGAALRDAGGFDVGLQALRVVDMLEIRYPVPGLNLCAATRQGLFKLRTPTIDPPPWIDREGLAVGQPDSLECQTVRSAWRAITPLHDVEDALAEGWLELRELLRIAAVERLVAQLKRAGAWPRGAYLQRAALHRALVHAAITDILMATRRRSPSSTQVGPSPRGAALSQALHELIETRVLSQPELRRADSRGARVLEGLFVAFYRDPLLLDDATLLRYRTLAGRTYLRDLPRTRQAGELEQHYHGKHEFVRVLADMLAGMTDHHAEQTWRQLSAMRSER